MGRRITHSQPAMGPKCWRATACLCLVVLHLCPLHLSWAAPADSDFPEEYQEDAENLSIAINSQQQGECECCLCSGYQTCVVHYHSDNLTAYRVEEVGPQQDSTLTCQLYRCYHDFDKSQVVCNREQRLLNPQEMSDEIQFLTPQESRCHEHCCLALIWSDPSESFYQDIVHESGQESCSSSCLLPTSTTVVPTSTSPGINTSTVVNVTWLETSQVTNLTTAGVGNSSGFETTINPDKSTSVSAEAGSVSLSTNESSSVQESGNRTSDAIHGENLEPATKDTNWTIVIVGSLLGVLVAGITIAIVVCLKRKEQLCFHNNNSATTEEEPMNIQHNSGTNEALDSASASLIQNDTNC